jgi:hypothetical protein
MLAFGQLDEPEAKTGMMALADSARPRPKEKKKTRSGWFDWVRSNGVCLRLT